jgi:hypothetical protein
VLTLEEQKLMYTAAKLNNGKIAGFDEDSGYGFGWCVEHDEKLGLVVSHSGGMPGVATWFQRWIDADRVLIILDSRDPMDARAFEGYWDGLQDVASDREPEPVHTIEEIALQNPDKSRWESWCGKYEHPEDADFIVDEVWMQDGELYAKAIDDDGDEMRFRLYPLGEKEFGRKGGMLKLTFGDGCVMFDYSLFFKDVVERGNTGAELSNNVLCAGAATLGLGREKVLTVYEKENDVEQTIGLPILCRIPVIKYLFSTVTSIKERTYEIVTAEAVLLHPEGQKGIPPTTSVNKDVKRRIENPFRSSEDDAPKAVPVAEQQANEESEN